MPLVFTPSAAAFQRWLPNWMRWPSQKGCLGPYVEPANHLPMQTINPEVPAMPEQNPAIQLDSEEQELLSDYDAGTWRSVATPGVLQSLREAARATGHQGSSLNLEATNSFQTPADPGSEGMFRARAIAARPIAELLLLPRREGLALAMALWESLDEVGRSESLPMDRELGEELDRRWTAHLQNPTAAISWDEVRNQLGLG